MIGIYKLVFEGLEDWPYVGQSRNIEARYKSHCHTLSRGIGNNLILEAYQLGGEPKLIVLEECKEEDLNTKERYWINKLNSMSNGLNKTPGGDIYFGSGINHYCSKYSRDQIITGMTALMDPAKRLVDAAKEAGIPSQTLYAIKSGITHAWFQEEFPEIFLAAQIPRRRSGYDHQRAKFSKEQILEVWRLLQDPSLTNTNISEATGVSVTQINGIAKGRTHQWLQEEFPKEYITIQNINRYLHCTYEDASVTLVSPTGEEFLTEGEGGAAFAKRIGESSAFGTSISPVMRGAIRSYKGWTLKGNEYKEYKLLSPIGTIETVRERTIKEFCDRNQVSRQGLALLLKGKQKQVLGWTLVKE